MVPIGPGFYPRIVLGLSALLSAILVVRDLLSAPRPPATQGAKADYPAVALHFAVFGLYLVALPAIGFRIATFVYVAAANALMNVPRGAKGWVRVVLLAFFTALVTWLVFERELLVLMPRGRWTDF
jgi:hypothetical protein